jgi:hypothetical protein
MMVLGRGRKMAGRPKIRLTMVSVLSIIQVTCRLISAKCRNHKKPPRNPIYCGAVITWTKVIT